MNTNYLLSLFCWGSLCLAQPAWGQQAPAAGFVGPGQPFPEAAQFYPKKLPDDLPQAKLLFIRFQAVDIPPDYTRYQYAMLKTHNTNTPKANAQLQEAAAKYPFPYRITTQDSVAYYYGQGYKYALYYNSFNSFVTQNFKGSSLHTSSSGTTMRVTIENLYVLDMSNGDRYKVDEFSETFTYYYKGIVGMLVKRVGKQFDAKNRK